MGSGFDQGFWTWEQAVASIAGPNARRAFSLRLGSWARFALPRGGPWSAAPGVPPLASRPLDGGDRSTLPPALGSHVTSSWRRSYSLERQRVNCRPWRSGLDRCRFRSGWRRGSRRRVPRRKRARSSAIGSETGVLAWDLMESHQRSPCGGSSQTVSRRRRASSHRSRSPVIRSPRTRAARPAHRSSPLDRRNPPRQALRPNPGW